ncbi:hypothetical protein ACOME3_003756 [Neoechinorhynchus agilis]
MPTYHSKDSPEKVMMRIPPNHYIHVLDNNLNISRVEIGPQTFILKDHEMFLNEKPIMMISVPPLHYCLIEHPVIYEKTSDEGEPKVSLDKYGQARLRHGDKEYRFEQEPFPLYPGEFLLVKPTRLLTVLSNEALRLKANVDFVEDEKTKRYAGEEWYFKGPAVYKPRKEVSEVAKVGYQNIKRNEALRVRAVKDCLDYKGLKRFAGEEWLIREVGDYLLGIEEQIVSVEHAVVLYDWKAICLEAASNHTDEFGVKRRAGDQWLVTSKLTDAYIADTCQTIVQDIKATELNKSQYCVIADPVDENGKNQVGTFKLIRGPAVFFLQPGEKIVDSIKPVYQLTENDGLILKCIDTMEGHQVGDLWSLRGPCEYVPPVTVQVVKERKAIALDENEGVYVRNTTTGKVRSVIGGNYMLTHEEELWEKHLPAEVEQLLWKDPLAGRSVNQPLSAIDQTSSQQSDSQKRKKYEVVRYQLPHNSAIRVYDFREKKSRVVFGPDLVLMQPDEEFTLLSLSGGVPKQPNAIKAICVLLGPDYFVDVFVIETSDHARLSLRLSMNWAFDVVDKSPEEQAKVYNVPDFIGNACKAIASRIRGLVSSVPFDEFHKNSAKLIREAVFGIDSKTGEVNTLLTFKENHLNITSIDIISLEPVDQKTRDALQRTVQLAIEITTNSQEAVAKHEAQRLKQEAEGKQERRKIQDEIEAERKRKELLELKAESATIESCGQSIAEAKSQAEAARIESERAVELTKLKEQAENIKAESEFSRLKQAREAELEYMTRKNEIELSRRLKEGEIEVDKFTKQIHAIGKETIVAIASSGPEMKVKMLQALGLKSALITDGNNPINLFDTAGGLIDFNVASSRKRQLLDPEE